MAPSGIKYPSSAMLVMRSKDWKVNERKTIISQYVFHQRRNTIGTIQKALLFSIYIYVYIYIYIYIFGLAFLLHIASIQDH